MSDAVNVASRLEGANKYCGTTILASETTFVLTGSKFFRRELDTIRVQGRSNPVRIYELIAEAGEENPGSGCGKLFRRSGALAEA
jgi:class 3 adenylate cyclase